jgi:hypothetical protein
VRIVAIEEDATVRENRDQDEERETLPKARGREHTGHLRQTYRQMREEKR